MSTTSASTKLDTNPTYVVVVTREGDDWLADVPELFGARLRS